MNIRNILIMPIIIIIALFVGNDLHANENRHTHRINCAREYREALNRLKKIDEIQSLIDRILAEGCIDIISNRSGGASFQGMWNGTERKIVINPACCRTLGEQISTILMELNNASTNQELTRICDMAVSGQLTKDQYVEKVERMEHANGLNTCRLLEKGHRKGIFPNDYCWKVYENFDDYYMLQQVLDHSIWIANNYNHLNPRGRNQPYQGTVPNLHRLSQRDRDDICLFLELKNDMNDTDRYVREMAQERFSRELHNLRRGGRGSWTSSGRNRKKAQLIEQIFKIQV